MNLCRNKDALKKVVPEPEMHFTKTFAKTTTLKYKNQIAILFINKHIYPYDERSVVKPTKSFNAGGIFSP